MAEIDPNRPPLSADELARDAIATGADPDAPPLVEAQDDEHETPVEGEAVETGLTRLPG